jgi:hypothetical protein
VRRLRLVSRSELDRAPRDRLTELSSRARSPDPVPDAA